MQGVTTHAESPRARLGLTIPGGLLLLTCLLAGGAWGQLAAPTASPADPHLEVRVTSFRTIPDPNGGRDAEGRVRSRWEVQIEGVDRSGADEFAVVPERTRLITPEGRVLATMDYLHSGSRDRDQQAGTWTFSMTLHFPAPEANPEADPADPPGTPGAGGHPPPAPPQRLLVLELDRWKALKHRFVWEAPEGLDFPLAGTAPGLRFTLQAPTLPTGEEGARPGLALPWSYENLATSDRIAPPTVPVLRLRTADGEDLLPEAVSGDLGQTPLADGMVLQRGVLTQRFPEVTVVPRVVRVELEVWRYAPWEEAWAPLPEDAAD